MVTPDRFNLFFEERSSPNRGRSTSDMEGRESLANDYGIEVLGPPLS